MKRNGKSTRGDIIIDLTSLLDVIFIILLVVLCGQNSVSERLSEREAEAKKKSSEAEVIVKLYKDQMDIADSLNQYVWSVSIVVSYDPSEITKRQIRLLKEGEEIECFDLIGNDIDESLTSFRDILSDYIEKNKERPVILSLNEEDENILYRDETAVNEILFELAKGYSNVYIKGNLSGD